MAREYSAELLSAGYRTSTAWPYSLGVLQGRPSHLDARCATSSAGIPPGRFPDPFEPAGEDSFVALGGHAPRPRAARRRCWRRSTQRGRASTARRAGSARCPCARCARSRSRLLEPLREALRAPRAAAAARGPRPGAPRRRAAGVRAAGRRRRPPGVPALARRTTASSHHKLKPSWCAALAGARPRASGVMRGCSTSTTRDARAGRAIPARLRRGARRAGVPRLARGPRGRARPSRVRALGPCGGSSRRGRPSASARSTAAGRTCASAYPDALGWPPAPGFVALAPSVRARGARPVARTGCCGSSARRSSTPACAWRRCGASARNWQALHPLAQTVFGRGGFSTGCRARRDANRSCPHGLDRLCAAARESPLDELRLLHRDRRRRCALSSRARSRTRTTRRRSLRHVAARPTAALGRRAGSSACAARRCRALACARARRWSATCARSRGWASCRARPRARCKAAGYPITTVDVDDAPQRQFDLTLPHEDRGHPLPFTIVHLNAPEAVRHAPRAASRGSTTATRSATGPGSSPSCPTTGPRRSRSTARSGRARSTPPRAIGTSRARARAGDVARAARRRPLRAHARGLRPARRTASRSSSSTTS